MLIEIISKEKALAYGGSLCNYEEYIYSITSFQKLSDRVRIFYIHHGPWVGRLFSTLIGFDPPSRIEL